MCSFFEGEIFSGKLLESGRLTTKILRVHQKETAPFQFEETLTRGSRAAEIFTRAARISQPVRAEVVLTHGLGEHSARYTHVAEALAEHGFRVWTYDLHAHGRSPGRRGDAPDYEVFLEDLACVIAQVPKDGAPLFLIGHSFGGQVTLNYLLRREVTCRGAVIASPWLRLAFRPAAWRLVLARLAMKVWPGFRQSTPHDWSRLSRDFEHLSGLPGSELMHHQLSARLFFTMVKEGAAALEGASRLQVPLLLIHGGEDSVTSAAATKEFYRKAGVVDKTFSVYPDARHETLNDLCRDQVIYEIVQWMEKRLGPKSEG